MSAFAQDFIALLILYGMARAVLFLARGRLPKTIVSTKAKTRSGS